MTRLLAALTLLASSAIAADRPNIVFAIADDWGWPHAGAYGDEGVKTPAFDSLASNGVLIEHAFISSPSCTPSRGAIITGQQFWRLGGAGNLWSVWPSTFPEYPALLAGDGYFVGSYRKAWGPGSHPNAAVNPGGKRYENVDAFFEARPDDMPFCFWFGASDPHRPYTEGSGAAAGIDLDKVHLFDHYPDAREIRGDVADYYFEVQRFDREVGALLEKLEAMGELDNTIIAMTGDHGMPFPRGKGNLYDSGARVPLAIQWKAQVPGGRRITDFVSTTDLAPTFVDTAGLEVPAQMTGRSLLSLLRSGKAGRVEADRDHIFFGRERHVVAQEAPNGGGYPARAIRTDDYLYIRNLRADRWPAGTPHYTKSYIENAWLADCDNGPTKWFLWTHRDDPKVKKFYELSFAKRPAEELYDIKKDPGQLNNIVADPANRFIRQDLQVRLMQYLAETGDPWSEGRGEFFDFQPFLGGSPKYPNL